MPEGKPYAYRSGRDHPASKPAPTGGEGPSRFGRDIVKNPAISQGEVPKMGRDLTPGLKSAEGAKKSKNVFPL